MSLTDQQNQEMARLGLKVLKFLYNLLLELIKKMNERQARENFDKLVKQTIKEEKSKKISKTLDKE